MIIDSYYKSDGYDYKDVVATDIKVDDFLPNLFGGAPSTEAAKTGTTGTGTKVTVGADPVSAIAGAVGSIFSFGQSIGDRKLAREQMDSQNTNLVIQAAMAKKEAERKQTTYIIIGIIAVLIILGITVIVIYKKK